MIVREYLSRFSENTSVTFVKARARKDAHSPHHHAEYQTTPIFRISELNNSNAEILSYFILNDRQQPIDWLSGARWTPMFENGQLLSLLVISEKDLETLYCHSQAQSLIKFIDEEIRKHS